MTLEERLIIIRSIFPYIEELSTTKGRSYAGTEDSLSNFKRNATRLGLSKYQIWGVYFNKHIDSINNAIADNPSNPKDSSESLKGRILDAITYLTILACLLTEDNLYETT